MKFKCRKNAIYISFHNPREGFTQEIHISRGQDCDMVEYYDENHIPIKEFFKSDGLYDCSGYKMHPEAHLYPRGKIWNMNKPSDLCLFCKGDYLHCGGNTKRDDRNMIVDCDKYQPFWK